MKRSVGIIILVLLLAFPIFYVQAAGPLPVISVGSVCTDAAPGTRFEVDIKLENNPGVVSMTIPITWDPAVLSLVEVKNTETVLPSWNGMPDLSQTTDLYCISWNNDNYREGNFEEDGILCTLVFQINEAVPTGNTSYVRVNSESALLSLMNFDMQDYSKGEVPGMVFSYVDGTITFPQESRHTIQGTVTSYGSETDDVTIQLFRKGSLLPEQEMIVQGKKTTYQFTDVAPGEYVIRVEKKGHVSREYTITVSE